MEMSLVFLISLGLILFLMLLFVFFDSYKTRKVLGKKIDGIEERLDTNAAEKSSKDKDNR